MVSGIRDPPHDRPALGTCVAREGRLAKAAGRRISREVACGRDSKIEGVSMRKLINLTMAGVLAMGLGMALGGCSEVSKTESQVTRKTPGGTT
jgi:hypothetical protein